MLKLKSNTKVWLFFYVVVFIGSLLLAEAIYVKNKEILNKTKSQQLYLAQIYNTRLNALFTKHETIHDLLEDDYINNPNFKVKNAQRIIALNPFLINVWIFSKEGKLLLSALPDMPVSSLLNNKNTRPWFQETLKADRMVIGKPYLLKSINQWTLPLRKKVLDNKGNIVAVISTGLDLTKLYKQWNKEDNHSNTIQVLLNSGAFRLVDSDKKVQDSPYNNSRADLRPYYFNGLNEYFNKVDKFNGVPVKNLYNPNRQQLPSRFSHKNNLSSEYFTQTPDFQDINSIPAYIYSRNPDELLYTVIRNERYNFFVSAERSYKKVLPELIQSSFFYCIFYLLLVALAFILFRWIDKIEKSKIAELTYKAEHDTITGLANHTVINKHFEKMQKHQKTPFALLYLDLDNFKNINKAFGHNYGQLILIEIAKRIRQSLIPCKEHSALQEALCKRTGKPCLVRFKGLAARYSGDEFVIFIESDNKDDIATCAKLLLKNIAQPCTINKNVFKVSASIGIARFPEDSTDIDTLLSYADSSVNLAKKRRNQYQFFSKSDHGRFTRNIEIEQALRHAIENKEISIVYQPQLDRNKKTVGVEALVRWNSRKLGFVAPDEFIAIAEEAGYMPQLGLYIMHKAMQEITKLKKQTAQTFKLSINVSARQFMQGDFIKKLLEACTLHSTDPATITIEITESLFIENIDRLLPIFDEMKVHNISLSLDDFGTGYSSLSMLRKVPIDELKIDKSFVDHITENQTDKAMLHSIISMGKHLGMSVLAEGVETQAHVEILENAGCDLFQGYYFSKPLALDKLQLFIKQQEQKAISKII
ncbi:MAG: EAL domain-containing protein [Psychromonas sp.]|nr:EAL domain-containing protein [Psychromonas sp.]